MDARTGAFLVLISVLGAIGFLLVAPLVQYVLAAGLLAFILYPVHQQLIARVRYVGPRISAGILTVVALVAAIVPVFVLTAILFDTVRSLSEGFTQQDILNLIETFRGLALEVGIQPEQITALEAQISTELTQMLSSATQLVFGELVGLLETTVRTSFGVIILLFLLYYFLRDGEQFVAWLRSVSPIEPMTVNELFDEISTVTWAVVGSHLLVALVEGVLGGIGLWIAGIPNAAFWMVVMIVVSVLPLIGVWIIWGPVVLWVLATEQFAIALFLIVYGATALVFADNYLRALFVDRNSGLHPAVVLIGVLGGVYLIGVVGLFLGPVLLAVFKASIVVFGRVTPEVGSTP